jgi:hypothetical protein
VIVRRLVEVLGVDAVGRVAPVPRPVA